MTEEQHRTIYLRLRELRSRIDEKQQVRFISIRSPVGVQSKHGYWSFRSSRESDGADGRFDEVTRDGLVITMNGNSSNPNVPGVPEQKVVVIPLDVIDTA